MKTIVTQIRQKRLMALVLFLLVGMTSVFAQKQVNVSGRITDELNEPMIGVSVLEKGTTNGVITDLDGNYTLSVNEGSTIVFSYIGYVTQEKKAVAGTMNIILKEDSKTLDEVVVVGYGVQKKSSVTGAISSVKAEDFENRTITNAEQALQGKTAGVQIISASVRIPPFVSVDIAVMPVQILCMWSMVCVRKTSVTSIRMILRVWRC